MVTKQSSVAERQAPLRHAYTQEIEKAMTVKRVRSVQRTSTDEWHGTIASDGFPNVAWEYGIDEKVGGYDDLPNPGHILCAALAACMESTIRLMANHLGVGIEHLEVEVAGTVDVRGCLAMESLVRPGFDRLTCQINLRPESGADERLVGIVLAQAEKLCVTLDTLRNGVPIEVVADVAATPVVSV